MSNPIPRRLIQTGKSQDLPLLQRCAAVSLRQLNPGFEYLYFDDAQVEAFVGGHFPQYREIFNNFPFRIQKYDFFRYLAVFHFGGFYFDLDVFFAKSLEDLLVHGCVFPFEELSVHRFLRDERGMDWEIGNFAFGAAAGNPFIGALIDNVVLAQRDPSWPEPMWRPIPRLFRREFYVLDTTGPGLVSRTLAEFPDAASHVTVLFPPDVCDSSYWHRFGDYGVHLQEGGWRSRKGFWHRKLGSIWETRTRAAFLRTSLAQGPHRNLEFRRAA